MPTPAEQRLQQLKDYHFGNPVDTATQERYRNFGSRALDISHQYISGDDRKRLFALIPDFHDTGDGEMFRGNKESEAVAQFGGVRTMAQWLLLARYPNAHYADLMAPDAFKEEKLQIGHEVAVATEKYYRDGNLDDLTDMAAQCVQRIGKMDLKAELSYAMGIDPAASPEAFRAATKAQPVVCSALLSSMASNAQNSQQLFSSIDPKQRGNLYDPDNGQISPTTKAIQSKLTQGEIEVYARGLGRMKAFANYDTLSKLSPDQAFETTNDLLDGQLDILAHDGQMASLSGAEQYMVSFQSRLKGDDLLFVQTDCQRALDKMFRDLPSGTSDSAAAKIDYKGLGAATGIPSMGNALAFSKLAQMATMVNKDMSVYELSDFSGRNAVYPSASEDVAVDVAALVDDPAKAGVSYGQTLAAFHNKVLETPFQFSSTKGSLGMLSDLHHTKITADLLHHGASLGAEIQEKSDLAPTFQEHIKQEDLDAMGQQAKGLAALQTVMTTALDKTRPMDERIAAHQTLASLKPELEGKTLSQIPNLEHLVKAHSLMQRNIVAADANVIVERNAQAFFRGDITYDQLRNPKQVFRDLPPLSTQQTLPTTLQTTPLASAEALYRLGQNPKKIGTPENKALTDAGVAAFDAHFGHLVAQHNHETYKASSSTSATSTFFIDGMKVEDYAKKIGRNVEDEASRKAMIMSALASGEHHVELGTLGMDERGNFNVNVSTVKMNLSALDGQESLFSRKPSNKSARLEQNDTNQQQRQDSVKKQLSEHLLSGMHRKMNHQSLNDNPHRNQILRFVPSLRNASVNGPALTAQFFDPTNAAVLQISQKTHPPKRDGDIFRGAQGTMGGLYTLAKLQLLAEHPDISMEDMLDPNKFKAEKLAAGQKVTDAYLGVMRGTPGGAEAMAGLVATGQKALTQWDTHHELMRALHLPPDTSKDALRAAMEHPANNDAARGAAFGIGRFAKEAFQTLQNMENVAPKSSPNGFTPVKDSLKTLVSPAESALYLRASETLSELGYESRLAQNDWISGTPQRPMDAKQAKFAAYQRDFMVEYGSIRNAPAEHCALCTNKTAAYPTLSVTRAGQEAANPQEKSLDFASLTTQINGAPTQQAQTPATPTQPQRQAQSGGMGPK